MIARQYGTKMQSVVPNFDANAMTEIGFRRDHEWSMPADDFLEMYEKLESHSLTATAEGDVQSEAEARLLQSLQDRLLAVGASAADGVVVIESEAGTDYPKTRQIQPVHGRAAAARGRLPEAVSGRAAQRA